MKHQSRKLSALALLAATFLINQPANAAEFSYNATLDICGGLCIALGGLFGIAEGSALVSTYDNATGDFRGQVGVGGANGVLGWNTATGPWELHAPGAVFPLGLPFSAGLTDDGSNITGGFLALQNLQDAEVGDDGIPGTGDEALATLIVYVSGSGPQDFGIAGGTVADWVSYLPGMDGSPDPASLVAAGSGTWTLAVDTDSDGFVDSDDNCTDVQNVSQLDVDGDGFGNACDADLDNNCFAVFADLALFGDNFGMPGENIADFDGNGFVNFFDLQTFGTLFGGAPGPSGFPNTCQ